MYSDFSWYRVGIPIHGFSIFERRHNFFMHTIRQLARRNALRRDGLADNHFHVPATNVIRPRYKHRTRTSDRYRHHGDFRLRGEHETAPLEWLDGAVATGSAFG